MYSNTAAVYRADLASHVFESSMWEQGLVATRVLPVVSAPRKQGQYPKFKLKEGKLLKREAGERAPYTGYPRGKSAYVQDTFATQDYGYEQAVDDSIAAEMEDFFDAEIVALKIARRKVLLEQEIRAAAAIFNTTTFGTATNSGTAYTEANLATFDVGLDVDKAKDRLIAKGETPNTVVIPYNVATRIKASTKLQNRARGVSIASDSILNLDESALQDLFQVDNVIIPRAVYDGAGDGATFSSTLIWANTYIWVGQVSTGGNMASMLDGGAGYTIAWSQYGNDMSVETYREERPKSDIVRAYQHVVEKITNPNAGDLIATQYS